jgi:hypothetical protein
MTSTFIVVFEANDGALKQRYSKGGARPTGGT